MPTSLRLATLGDLSHGVAEAVIDDAIGVAVTDTEDRGSDGKSRKVVITLDLKLLDNGNIAVAVETDVRLPKKRTSTTIGEIRATGDGRPTVQFQPLAPGNPRQGTIQDQLPTGKDEA